MVYLICIVDLLPDSLGCCACWLIRVFNFLCLGSKCQASMHLFVSWAQLFQICIHLWGQLCLFVGLVSERG